MLMPVDETATMGAALRPVCAADVKMVLTILTGCYDWVAGALGPEGWTWRRAGRDPGPVARVEIGPDGRAFRVAFEEAA